MKLITETNWDEVSLIEESNGKGKSLYIEGPFAQAAKKNRNGRIYPEHILEREVNRFINEKVLTNKALGELEHPQSPTINLERASHRIVSLRKEGSDFIGKALLLSTPCGEIAKGLVEGGTQLGVSTRGMGSVTERKGYNEINEDFRLVTVDIVGDPSGPDCFTNGVMESVEWMLDESGIFKTKEREKVFLEAKKVVPMAQKLELLEKFMLNL